jgi:hypothetical protein
MVGIHKKVKKLLGIIQKYSPILSAFVPGLGEVVGLLSELGEDVADGVNNVHEDYSMAKNDSKKYNFGDGIRSFLRNGARCPSSPFGAKPKGLPKITHQNSAGLDGAVKTLTKDYGELHPRLKLKEAENESDEE